MSFLERFFGPKNDPAKDALRPLYDAAVAKARALHWYERGGVPDTLDGRFEMVAAMLSLILIRLEGEDGQDENSVHLTEIFVDDMDGQLREIGIGDMMVGKHIGRMMAALGGRMGAYREGLRDEGALAGAAARNIFRTETASEDAIGHVTGAIKGAKAKLDAMPVDMIIAGAADW
ncbi:MAG: ubiquinol-cytochrome C chaperone family protein [Sphingorhabdus sp.]